MIETIDASRCPRCDAVVAPPATWCPWHPVPMTPTSVRGVGQVVSFTTLHSAPEGFRSPLHIAIVELEGGARFVCHGAETRGLRIGSIVSIEAIDNIRTGTMEKLGLGYATLSKLNPRLVYCAMSGFGESGPESHRGGYDLIVQAESGVMDLTGFPGGPPVKVGNSIADLVTGMSGAHGVTLALLARQRTKRGQKVEIAMLDVMASLLTYQAGMYLNGGRTPARRGNEHPSIVPYEVFKAADAYLVIGAANDSLWERCCAALERPDLAKERRYATVASRVEHRATLVPLLNEILSTRPAAEWLKRLEAAGVPAGRIRTVPEVCESEHLKARGIGRAAASVGGP